ncbi:MAG TPA: OmpH family outer membrane protein [Negativicutes bacterium]|nr:OmpH family outer membrane protein [Negativicutes bacterium]
MKKYTRWSAFLVIIMVSTVLLAGCGAEKPSTIGIVDMQKVMTENPKIKQMQEQLNTKAKELTANLEKEKATLKPEEFQQKEQLAYAEFMRLKQEFETQIEAQTKKVLEEVAKEKKLGAVIYKNGMAWGGIDVTEDVLKKLQ